jgi:hypothetical protein
VGHLPQPLAKIVEIGRQLGIFENSILLYNFSIRLAAKVDLVGLAEKHEFSFAANRIDRTRNDQKNKSDHTESKDGYLDMLLYHN